MMIKQKPKPQHISTRDALQEKPQQTRENKGISIMNKYLQMKEPKIEQSIKPKTNNFLNSRPEFKERINKILPSLEKKQETTNLKILQYKKDELHKSLKAKRDLVLKLRDLQKKTEKEIQDILQTKTFIFILAKLRQDKKEIEQEIRINITEMEEIIKKYESLSEKIENQKLKNQQLASMFKLNKEKTKTDQKPKSNILEENKNIQLDQIALVENSVSSEQTPTFGPLKINNIKNSIISENIKPTQTNKPSQLKTFTDYLSNQQKPNIIPNNIKGRRNMVAPLNNNFLKPQMPGIAILSQNKNKIITATNEVNKIIKNQESLKSPLSSQKSSSIHITDQW